MNSYSRSGKSSGIMANKTALAILVLLNQLGIKLNSVNNKVVQSSNLPWLPKVLQSHRKKFIDGIGVDSPTNCEEADCPYYRKLSDPKNDVLHRFGCIIGYDPTEEWSEHICELWFWRCCEDLGLNGNELLKQLRETRVG